jgi:glutaredoxin
MRAFLLVAVGLVACAAPPPPAPKARPASVVAPPRRNLEAAMREVPVTMYMTEWCPYCQKAREWLREGRYSFVEVDVERDEKAATLLHMLNPRGSVPMFDVDGQIVVGFEPSTLREALYRAAQRRQDSGSGVAALE